MKKTLLRLLTLTCFTFSLSADTPSERLEIAQNTRSIGEDVPEMEGTFPTEVQASTPAEPDEATDTANPLPDSKYVGKASDDGVRSGKSQQWQNVALAVGAIAVATTALILVSSHKGSRAN